MKTYSLGEAAQFLHVHPEELRKRARRGKIPGAKVGRAWILLEDDLVEHVRSLYPQPRQALQVTLRKEVECHFAGAGASGGSTLSPQPGNEYAALLGLPTKP